MKFDVDDDRCRSLVEFAAGAFVDGCVSIGVDFADRAETSFWKGRERNGQQVNIQWQCDTYSLGCVYGMHVFASSKGLTRTGEDGYELDIGGH